MRGLGSVPWLYLDTGSKLQEPANQQQQALTAFVDSSQMPPGTHRATIIVAATNTADDPNSLIPGRATIASLPPLSVSVTLTVTGPVSAVGPRLVNRNVIPGGNTTQELLVENKGTSTLQWLLKLQPEYTAVEWLAACDGPNCAYAGDPATHSAVHAQVSRLSSDVIGDLRPEGGGLQGSVEAGDSVLVTVYLLSPGVLSTGLFSTGLVLETNEYDPVLQQKGKRVEIKVSMRSTLLSVVPDTVQLAIRPGGHSSGISILQTLSDIADLSIELLDVVSTGTSTVPDWLRVIASGKLLQLAAGTGQETLILAAQHQSRPCLEAIPGLICGGGSFFAEVLVRITAQPVAGISTADSQALLAYSETRSIPVVLEVLPGQVSSQQSEVDLELSQALRPQGLGEQLTVRRADGSLQRHSVVSASDSSGVALVGGVSSAIFLNSKDDSGLSLPFLREFPKLQWLQAEQGSMPVARTALLTLDKSRTVFSMTGQKLGSDVLLVSSRGSTWKQGGVSHPPLSSSVSTLRAACDPVSEQLTDSRLGCQCAAGFQLGRQRNTTASRCERCPAGTVRSAQAEPSSACQQCPAGTFANLAQYKCTTCPLRGVQCGGGLFKPSRGFWCETCVSDVSLISSNAEVSRRHVSWLARAAREELQREVAARANAGRRLQDILLGDLDAVSTISGQSIVNASTNMVECAPADACRPSANGTAVTCAQGHIGILCGECAPGWARASPQTLCTKCPEEDSGVASSVMSYIVFTGIVVYLALRTSDDAAGEKDPSAGLMIGLFRIITGWSQMYAVLLSTRSPPQSPLDSVMAWVSSVSMGVSTSSVPAQCTLRMDLYSRFYLSLALPLAAAAAPAIVGLLVVLGKQAVSACATAKHSSIADRARQQDPRVATTNMSPRQRVSSLAMSTKVNAQSLDKSASSPAKMIDDTKFPTGGQAADLDDSLPLAVRQHTRDSEVSIAISPVSGARRRSAWDDVAEIDDVTGLDAPHASLVEDHITVVQSLSGVNTPGQGTSQLISMEDVATKGTQSEAPQSPVVSNKKPTHRLREQLLRAAFILLLMVHFPVVEACLRMLDTYDLPMYGLLFLRVDVRYGSMDNQFSLARTLAFTGLAVWGVGIPILGAVLISRHRSSVHLKRVQSVYGAVYEGFKIPSLAGLSFPQGTSPRSRKQLARNYISSQPNFWFWELLIVLPRKVLLAVLAVTVRNGPLQISLIAVVLSVSLVAHIASMPFELMQLNVVETAALSAVWVSAFGGLALADPTVVGTNSTIVLQFVIFSVNLLFAVIAFVLVTGTVLLECSARRNAVQSWLESASPGAHGERTVPSCIKWPSVYGWRRTCSAFGAMLRCYSVRKGIKLAGDLERFKEYSASMVANVPEQTKSTRIVS